MEPVVYFTKSQPIPIVRNSPSTRSSSGSSIAQDDDESSSSDFLFSTKDEHYNAATWRMYHRIIQHRRQQQSHRDENSNGAIPIASPYCYYDPANSKMRERQVSMQDDTTSSSVDGIFSLEL